MTDKERDERRARVGEHVAMLCKWTGEDADGLFELMERLASGNPRLTKAERTSINTFIDVLIKALGTYARQIEDSHELWTKLDENCKLLQRNIDLQEELNEHMMTAIRDRNWDGLVEFERRYRK